MKDHKTPFSLKLSQSIKSNMDKELSTIYALKSNSLPKDIHDLITQSLFLIF